MIAVDISNTHAGSALPWGSYRSSVDAIEASADLKLFDQIPTAVQNDLEAEVDAGPTEQGDDQMRKVQSAVPFCVCRNEDRGKPAQVRECPISVAADLLVA